MQTKTKVKLTIEVDFDKVIKPRTDLKRAGFDYHVHQSPVCLTNFQMLDLLDHIRYAYHREILEGVEDDVE